MIKAIMVLKKDQIPPQLNFINPKPTLRLEERGIRVRGFGSYLTYIQANYLSKVPLELTPLTPKGHVGPRRVSVNSFGYGGTNAHAILEAYDGKSLKNGFTNGHTNGHTSGHSNGHTNGYTNGHANGDSNGHTNGHTNGRNNAIVEESEEEQEDGKERLITLSANSELSLNSLMSRLGEWLGTDMAQDASFADLAYTLNVRRSKLPWRSTIVARNSKDLARALGDAKPRPVKSSRDVAVGFIFTGQGAQWHAMGRELLSDSHEFATSIALCNQIMKDAGSEWDLVEELSRDKDTSRLSDARFSQPCTTAVQIAMVDLLESFGIRPEALCGHSSGEVAAAYAAGILSRAAAMQVAYNRGICSAQAKDLNITKGSMLAVGEGEEAISKRIQGLDKTNGRVTVACVNSPESTTISGDLPAILELQAVLDAASVFNRRLKVDSAYHSHHMEVVAKSYLASLSDMSHGAPHKDVAFYSSVIGTRKLADFGPSYWVANLVSQVKFDAASKLVAEHLSAAHPSATNVVIEVGPHAALSGPLRQTLSNFTLASGATFKYNYLSCLMRNQSATETALTVAGKIFEYGGQVHLDAVTAMGKGKAASIFSYKVVGNMPTYAWDHSSTYWHESRLSKDHRLRPFPRHDLLGTYDYYSSLHEPRWRYYVSLEHLPWLRDHVVEGLIVFPGVGYLIMVIEAMKQLFQLRKTPGSIKNVNLRDVNFLKAVVVPDDNAQDTKEVEMHLMISPSRQYAGTSWQEFSVVSYDPKNDAWVENCSGLTSWDAADSTAQPEVNEAVDIADDTLGHLTSAAAADMLRDCQTNSDLLLDPTEVYAGLAKTGNEYGPNFQGMKEIHVGKNRSYFKVVVENIVQQMPSQYQQPHTIHPSTFDSIIQPVALMFHRECALMPIMPTSLADMSVAVDIDETPGSELFVAFKFVPESRREGLAEFCTYQKQADGTFRPVITAYKVRPQAVGDMTSDDSAEKKASYRMEWKPDVNYLTQNDFMNHLSSQDMFDIHSSDGQPVEAQLSLNDTVAAIFIRRALQEMQTQGISSASNAHLSKLLAWMTKWNETEADKLLEGVTAEQETRLIEEASRSNIAGLILSRLGPHYLDLITGKVSAVELMAQDDLLRRLYLEHTLFSCHYTQMAEYMQHLVHKNPYIKVLEIDAGTGGATLPVLEKMERGDQLLVHEYTYTSVSSGSFELARTKFGKWESQINFKTLDISRDPLAQGYAANSFDVVVAAMELHAVPRMDAALANVRSLLKPGGRLVLMELTAVSAAHNAIFGTLASWWKSEDGRQDGPLLSVPEWDACLKRHGFSGTDLAIPAHKGPSSDISTMIVARAIDASEAKAQNTSYSASVHLGHSDDTQATIGDKLCLSLTEAGVKCAQTPWTLNPSAAVNELAIVVDSAENPLLLDPSPETFEQIKQLLLQGRNILWASFQCAEPSAETAAMKHMINGLARVMRRENPGLHLITVDIQDQINPLESSRLENTVDTLKNIAKSFWPQSEADKTEENEYVIRDGQLTIPRVVPDDRFKRYVESLSPAQDKCEATTYMDNSRPLMLDVQVPGLLNTLRFVDNESMSEPLGPDQVEIEARAHGLNQKDVSVALGRSAPGTTMLGEVAGVITAVGSNVSSWKAGDRVIGLLASPFGNQVRINGNGVVAVPDSISFSDAASIPWVYYTAWYCLTQVARLEKDQSVLIHAASGGVGQAAIQLAKLIGAEIFVTVSGASKKELLQQQYGIPSRNILSYRDFKKQIMSLTQGKGVDAILNSLSGQALMDSWDCVAQFGTFLEIGKADINGRSQLDMSNFEKQVTFAAVDPSLMYQLRPQQVTRGLREIFAMFERGQLKTVHPVTVYPMTRVEETFRLVAARKHLGKVVLVADEKTQVQATRPKSAPLRLSKDGTYVIGGGLGDLGKKIGCFLASKGAGHIVALTRRTLDAEQRAPLEEMISSLGATLHVVKCDINDESSTLVAAQSIAHLPPVRGIVQSATVLADHPLEYMEHADWATAVKPKVQGTVNMNKAFCSAESTEFFVMLSSVASIFGSSSQGNYAAGNAFLDAFAHAQSQYSQGVTKYTTINVGAVEGSGLVNQALSQNSEFVRTVGSVSFDEVLATIEYAMKPQSQVDQAKQCLMPFNRDSMEEAMGPEALGDHLFDHVPSKSRQGAKTSTGAADSKKASAIQAVEQAETLAEAEDIVKGAILEKFAAFTGDDVPEDQSVAALGLDSLVSIELKNWVKHTFQTPMQTSELIGAANIVVLAKLVVSRMDLKCNPKAADSSDGEQKQESVGQHGQESPSEAANDAVAKLSHGHECCKFHAELPVQPLPDLDVSLDFWLEANKHLFSPEQLESIHADIESLRAADSPARQILEILYSEHADDKTNGWLTDLVSKGRFLCSRASVAPGSSIMGAYRQSKVPRSQAEHAAVIALSTLSFKRAVSAGQVEPLDLGGKPECTWGWKWLFNSIRVPQLECDKMVNYTSDDPTALEHIAVLRKGHVFKVMLQDELGKDVSFAELQATFEAITERVQDDGVWSGMLTTDERDSWAEVSRIRVIITSRDSKLIVFSNRSEKAYRPLVWAMRSISRLLTRPWWFCAWTPEVRRRPKKSHDRASLATASTAGSTSVCKSMSEPMDDPAISRSTA